MVNFFLFWTMAFVNLFLFGHSQFCFDQKNIVDNVYQFFWGESNTVKYPESGLW